MFDWTEKYGWVLVCLAVIYVGGHVVVYLIKSLFGG
jgi:hypothetical protein